jgi:conjugative relaxase-like TrwC/TraI family protein
VISIGKLRSVDYYLREIVDGAEDYYLAGEVPGRWSGRGAELLGFAGLVDGDDLGALFEGRNPRTSAPLTETGPRLAGFDLTFSAPKSVSVLWGLSDEAAARGVVEGVERSVGEAARYLEREACRVRRGRAGFGAGGGVRGRRLLAPDESAG